jgi:hypothetical protein
LVEILHLFLKTFKKKPLAKIRQEMDRERIEIENEIDRERKERENELRQMREQNERERKERENAMRQMKQMEEQLERERKDNAELRDKLSRASLAPQVISRFHTLFLLLLLLLSFYMRYSIHLARLLAI